MVGRGGGSRKGKGSKEVYAGEGFQRLKKKFEITLVENVWMSEILNELIMFVLNKQLSNLIHHCKVDRR